MTPQKKNPTIAAEQISDVVKKRLGGGLLRTSKGKKSTKTFYLSISFFERQKHYEKIPFRRFLFSLSLPQGHAHKDARKQQQKDY